MPLPYVEMAQINKTRGGPLTHFPGRGKGGPQAFSLFEPLCYALKSHRISIRPSSPITISLYSHYYQFYQRGIPKHANVLTISIEIPVKHDAKQTLSFIHIRLQ